MLILERVGNKLIVGNIDVLLIGLFPIALYDIR